MLRLFSILLIFGTSTFAQTSITVTPLQSFGLVSIGESATKTFNVSASNTASADFTVTSSASQYVATPSTFTLAPSASQTVTVTYTPTATPAIQKAKITVAAGTSSVDLTADGRVNPYGAPTNRLVCVLDATTHAIMSIDGLQQCFAVPIAVDQAYQSYMLDTVDYDGSTFTYRYANVWDYIVRYFINDVLAKLDRYPPADVAAAKDQAQQKLLAVDAAKAAILQGAQPQQ